jgi:hypothetical protein
MGSIYEPTGEKGWKNQFAMLPTPILIDDETLRIFIGFCDENNVGRIGYVDTNPENPSEVKEISKECILDIGKDGCFDDNGVVPISIEKNDNGDIYLYYIGFQLGVKVPYYMFCGLAISKDNGKTFERYSDTPILDRVSDDLYARCGVNVLNDNGTWKMWYIGTLGDGWTKKDGKLLPLYTMKYLESKDGINWSENKAVKCLEFKNEDEHGFGRPFVFKEDDMYKMFYSIRTYSRGYYIGYAESKDGINWDRKDELAGIEPAENSWDDTNLSYPYLFKHKQNRYMFYNGNGCGKSGFGYAKEIKDD